MSRIAQLSMIVAASPAPKGDQTQRPAAAAQSARLSLCDRHILLGIVPCIVPSTPKGVFRAAWAYPALGACHTLERGRVEVFVNQQRQRLSTLSEP